MLCQSCQKKLETGEITEKDVIVARELINLESQFPNLKDVTIKKIIHTPKFNILIVNKGNIANLIGPKGKILRILENKIGKKLRVVEDEANPIKVIEDLLSPMKVLGINKVFLPTGETIQKVRVKKYKRVISDKEVEELENLIYNLTGKHVRLSFE